MHRTTTWSAIQENCKKLLDLALNFHDDGIAVAADNERWHTAPPTSDLPSDAAVRAAHQRMKPAERSTDAWRWAADQQLSFQKLQKVPDASTAFAIVSEGDVLAEGSLCFLVGEKSYSLGVLGAAHVHQVGSDAEPILGLKVDVPFDITTTLDMFKNLYQDVEVSGITKAVLRVSLQ
jgi:hypothetical protein